MSNQGSPTKYSNSSGSVAMQDQPMRATMLILFLGAWDKLDVGKGSTFLKIQ